MKKRIWKDITDHFVSASSTLSPGLLIHEPSFCLYDAMSAIEIADSKMDAIVQWKQLPGYPHSLKEAMCNNQIKLEGHTPSELIGIFDEVLACVATWLQGHTLAQTVFTCMYLLDPSQLEDPVFRGFAMAVIKVVYMLKEIITKGGVFVEDEQQVICYGLNMLQSVDEEAVLAVLKMAKDKAQSLLKAASRGVIHDPESCSTFDCNSSGDSRAKELAGAVLVRIQFIRSLFLFISSFRKRTREGVQASEQQLETCLSNLKDVSTSIHLGKEMSPSNPIRLGFHPLINQHLLPPSYRSYCIMSREKAMAFLTKSLGELHRVYEIGRLNTISDIFSSLAKLSTVEDSPNIISRSFISHYCLDDRVKTFGSKPVEDMIKEEVKSLFNPPCLNPRSPASTTPLIVDLVNRSLGHIRLPFVELLRLYCHHRAKQRTMIGSYLDTICDLQHDLETADHQLFELTLKVDPQRQQTSCFHSWLVYYVSQLFLDYLHIGFEYNLYSPFEYHYILWYLEFIYGWKQMTLKSASKQLYQEPHSHGKNKKKSKGKKKEFSKEREFELGKLQVKRMICIGLMRSCEALMLDGRIPKPNFQFGSEALIFYNRFLPFSGIISPHPLTYTDYQQLAGIKNYKGSELNLYDASYRHFGSAKSTLELVQYSDQEMGQLLKVIKTNLVIMKLAATGHKGEVKNLPKLDFSLHREFPVIRL